MNALRQLKLDEAQKEPQTNRRETEQGRKRPDEEIWCEGICWVTVQVVRVVVRVFCVLSEVDDDAITD